MFDKTALRVYISIIPVNIDARQKTDTMHIHLTEVDSTNTYAKNRFAELADGALVTADHQTQGRGRLGRTWQSPVGLNVLASFVIKHPGENPFYATCCASLAVLEVLREVLPGADFFIKWPNDVFSGNAKIAGVLCEGIMDGNHFAGVVAGMGINVNMTEEHAAKVDAPMTSLKILSGGRHFDIAQLTDMLEKTLRACYVTYLKFPDRLFAQWRGENRLIGRRISLDDANGGHLHGILEDILPDGSLRFRDETGSRVYRCGDVRISRDSLMSNNNFNK